MVPPMNLARVAGITQMLPELFSFPANRLLQDHGQNQGGGVKDYLTAKKDCRSATLVAVKERDLAPAKRSYFTTLSRPTAFTKFLHLTQYQPVLIACGIS